MYDAKIEAQEFVEAITLLTRALELHRRGEGALTRAEARFTLARALWDALPQQGRDRERALSLAERARADYLDGGPYAAESLAEVDAWLAARGPA